jgi:hypothetical protein
MLLSIWSDAIPSQSLQSSSRAFRLEGLGQELDGARFHRSHGHRYIAVTGDEDDRHLAPIGELLLQLDAVQPRTSPAFIVVTATSSEARH